MCMEIYSKFYTVMRIRICSINSNVGKFWKSNHLYPIGGLFNMLRTKNPCGGKPLSLGQFS